MRALRLSRKSSRNWPKSLREKGRDPPPSKRTTAPTGIGLPSIAALIRTHPRARRQSLYRGAERLGSIVTDDRAREHWAFDFHDAPIGCFGNLRAAADAVERHHQTWEKNDDARFQAGAGSRC